MQQRLSCLVGIVRCCYMRITLKLRLAKRQYTDAAGDLLLKVF